MLRTVARVLRRDLGLAAAVSVVVGSMIGVGIFLGPRVIATYLSTPGLVMLAWVLGGLLVFCGALTYAELGAAFPESGGIYAYVRRAYGPLPAFLTGWSGFAIGKAASVSALAVAFGEYLPPLLAGAGLLQPGQELTRLGVVLVALVLIALLTFVNVLGVRHAGRLGVVAMVVKVGALGVLVVGGVLLLGGRIPALVQTPLLPADASPLPLLSAMGLALIPVFFAYDGWVNATMVAEEVKDPGRNVPRAVILGTLGVVVVYALVNLAYFLALGPANVGQSGAAALSATALFGSWGGLFVTLAILVSIVGTINAVILSGPRIAYAMARDGVFFRGVEKVTRFGTPGWSIALQGLVSALLVLLPPIGGQPLFDTLLTYVIVDSFIFYGLGAGAIFLMRRRHPDVERPYRVPLYPLVPLVFIAGSALFLLNAFITSFWTSVGGVALVLAALPGYWYWSRANAATRVRSVTYAMGDAAASTPGATDDDAPDAAAGNPNT